MIINPPYKIFYILNPEELSDSMHNIDIRYRAKHLKTHLSNRKWIKLYRERKSVKFKRKVQLTTPGLVKSVLKSLIIK